MTDRYNAFTVILEEDIREDDAQSTIEAIKHIKGVVTVIGHVDDPSEKIAEQRVKHELIMKILEILK